VSAPPELRDALVMQNFKLMALMMAAPEAVAAAKAANCIPTVLAGYVAGWMCRGKGGGGRRSLGWVGLGWFGLGLGQGMTMEMGEVTRGC
jgi:hypothetical protein